MPTVRIQARDKALALLSCGSRSTSRCSDWSRTKKSDQDTKGTRLHVTVLADWSYDFVAASRDIFIRLYTQDGRNLGRKTFPVVGNLPWSEL